MIDERGAHRRFKRGFFMDFAGGSSYGQLTLHPVRNQIRIWSGIFAGQGEDAGGLTPFGDDNAAIRKSSPRTGSISGRMKH